MAIAIRFDNDESKVKQIRKNSNINRTRQQRGSIQVKRRLSTLSMGLFSVKLGTENMIRRGKQTVYVTRPSFIYNLWANL